MIEKPILFSAPMVRANRADLKSQTRRGLTRLRKFGEISEFGRSDTFGYAWHFRDGEKRWHDLHHAELLQYLPIQTGDRLWVREAWWIAERYSYGTTPGGCEVAPPPLAYRRSDPVHYAADGNPPNCENRHYGPNGLRNGSFAAPDPYAVWIKKPSIHMPRWASRDTYIVTDVRIERLQDISEADAIAEGVERHHAGWMPYSTSFYEEDGITPANYHKDPRESYRQLWNKINGFGAWEQNPWVVAYTYADAIRQRHAAEAGTP